MQETGKRIAIIGASGKLGRYMVAHALERGYEVVAVCRPKSVAKLDAFKDAITIVPGRTDDRAAIRKAVSDCDAVLTVLVPWGVHGYATNTAQAVLDFAPEKARLIFSCGWHISRDGKDVYPLGLRLLVPLVSVVGRLLRLVDIRDQENATRRIFESGRRWTVVRGSDLEEGESEGLPVWSRHVGDPILASNRTRRIDFALFMVTAIEDESLVQEAPAIVSCKSQSAMAAKGAAALTR
ncbi:NAD(P)-dependent oxidoreductase [Rhizobium sp. L1K21]|uniref:NAD(P)-dependent oxidoreductase n=1 Tax=Rhizobium sp. L1K21 TaxID=2954933 RepID=UPI002093AF5D|nr:NAD(P)H-binding protein [Rhizobium sp. L1K21]MCO6188263.1 NAD(P)H-binding protein [Rhizobium sp. L1K21]